MSVNFFMLLFAALIFRYLGMRARATFVDRFARLLGCAVSGRRVAALLRQHPKQADGFCAHVLPFAGLRLGLDALACATFVASVFFFPPAIFGERDLTLLQYGSAMIVLIALLVDAAAFCRSLVLAWELKSAP
jgi:hypothetical protein